MYVPKDEPISVVTKDFFCGNLTMAGEGKKGKMKTYREYKFWEEGYVPDDMRRYRVTLTVEKLRCRIVKD